VIGGVVFRLREFPQANSGFTRDALGCRSRKAPHDPAIHSIAKFLGTMFFAGSA
jgi:hypothetical protein